MSKKVINGDSLLELAQMPGGMFDAIVTDPPYCVPGSKSTKAKYVQSGQHVVLDGLFSERSRHEHHQTQKPTAPMAHLLGAVAPCGHVLDPFCGSGSSGARKPLPEIPADLMIREYP